jgi:hypothetical protein
MDHSVCKTPCPLHPPFGGSSTPRSSTEQIHTSHTQHRARRQTSTRDARSCKRGLELRPTLRPCDRLKKQAGPPHTHHWTLEPAST